MRTDWSFIAVLNSVKLGALLIENGSHKRYGTLTRIFWSELYWWGLKEWNSCCLQIDRILPFSTLLSPVLCWWKRVAKGDGQRWANSSSRLGTLVLQDIVLSWAVLMSSQKGKQLLSTAWSYITLQDIVKLSTLLIKKGSHKQDARFTTLAVVWSLCGFTIFFWSEFCWWAQRERKNCCLKIDGILHSLTLISWALC